MTHDFQISTQTIRQHTQAARLQMNRIGVLLDGIDATDNTKLPQTVLSYARHTAIEAVEMSGNLCALHKQLAERADALARLDNEAIAGKAVK